MKKHKLISISIVLILALMFSPVTVSDDYNKQGDIIVHAGGDGDYTSLQTAISNANNGDTIYVWSGTYYENSTVVNKRLDIIGNGTSNTIIHGNNGGILNILLVSHDNVTIQDIRLTSIGGCGIYINNSNDIIVQHIVIDNIASSCIEVYNASDVILNNVSFFNGSYCLELDDVNHINVSHSYFEGDNRGLYASSFISNITVYKTSFYDLDCSIWIRYGASDVVIRDSYCWRTTFSGFYGVGIWVMDDSSNVYIYNNTVFGMNGASGGTTDPNCGIKIGSISVYDISNVTIDDNFVYNCSNAGVWMDVITYANVTDNVVAFCSVGIETDDEMNMNIISNTVYNTTSCGIMVYQSEKGYVFNASDNYLYNITSCGVEVYESDDSTLYNNTIYSNVNTSGDGIYISGDSENITYDSNDIYGFYAGINATWGNWNQIIKGNYVRNNTVGVWLSTWENDYNITSNYIYYNMLGINVTGDNNLIYNNYFNNTKNGVDYGSGNYWNITKTLGTNIIGGPYLMGNYWSDYGGVDVDGDGIGETPYVI